MTIHQPIQHIDNQTKTENPSPDNHLQEDNSFEEMHTFREEPEGSFGALEGNIVESDGHIEKWEEYIENVTLQTTQIFDPVVSNINYENQFPRASQNKYMSKDKRTHPKRKYQQHFPSSAPWTIAGDFVCTYPGCNKRYRFKWDSETHIRTVHEGLEFKCDACGKKFSKRANMQAHKRQSCHFKHLASLVDRKDDKSVLWLH